MEHRVVSLRCKISADIGLKADKGQPRTRSEHDPEKWYRFSEKIMLKQKDRAG